MSAPLREYEPIRGLPEPLPAGERILWQGAPAWTALARRALHVDKLAVYFAVLLAWRGVAALADGAEAGQAALAVARLSPLVGLVLGFLVLLAWLTARATVYTITDRRLVLRIGLALPLVVNVPFKIVRSAAFRTHPDGTGDLPLALEANGRLGYVHLWPHARPWSLGRAEPMLRCVPDAARVAGILARALAAAAGQPAPTVVAPAQPETESGLAGVAA